ncbi:sarcosine oxidase subunit delta [Marinobacterium aestuarii]|uniref:Sarcosine oxidase subunit delta n=1 Tax=Marinobacterium aestuarii TaxID=1821621 RepID=A0A1A9EUP0_9GAMM|nr:sarcosine oxidase subunit delta [Marinobacterium aestuarii]ANG61557.1 sarcosine oxidase subunit delta [Marinobacterium aestuarii]
MFYIYCPHCGEHREEEEFHAKGQAHLARPLDPDNCTDHEWGEYLYMRKNPRGLHHELWIHATGCRKFFNMTRDTVSYEIKEVYKIGERPTVVAAS